MNDVHFVVIPVSSSETINFRMYSISTVTAYFPNKYIKVNVELKQVHLSILLVIFCFCE